MLQEPYMFNYSSGANTQHEFKEKLNNLVGSENTELFLNHGLIILLLSKMLIQ